MNSAYLSAFLCVSAVRYGVKSNNRGAAEERKDNAETISKSRALAKTA